LFARVRDWPISGVQLAQIFNLFDLDETKSPGGSPGLLWLSISILVN
jgi:hypothetical protein